MTRSLLPPVCVLLVLVHASATWAEPEDPEIDVRRRFATGNEADAAWAAWIAAENRVPGVEDEIQTWLRTTAREQLSLSTWALRSVLLDAALRLHVPLDDVLLADLARSHPEAVAVHLVRRPGNSIASASCLFDMWERDQLPATPAWVALGNLLGRSAAPGFAGRVLGRLRMQRTLEVYDPDHDAFAAPPPPPSGRVPGCGTTRLPPGYPPLALYELTLTPKEGRLLLIAGPPPVFVERRVHTERDLGFASSLDDDVSKEACCWIWLRSWLPAEHARRLLPLVDSLSLSWTGRQPWDRALQPWVDALHAQHWAIVRALIAAARLTTAEAQRLPPNVHFTVVDHRRDTRRPCPPPPTSRVPDPFGERALRTRRALERRAV